MYYFFFQISYNSPAKLWLKPITFFPFSSKQNPTTNWKWTRKCHHSSAKIDPKQPQTKPISQCTTRPLPLLHCFQQNLARTTTKLTPNAQPPKLIQNSHHESITGTPSPNAPPSSSKLANTSSNSDEELKTPVNRS